MNVAEGESPEIFHCYQSRNRSETMPKEFQVDPKREAKATVTDKLEDVWPDSGYSQPGLCLTQNNGNYKDHLPFCCPGCGHFGAIPCTSPKDKDGIKSWEIRAGTLSDPTTLTLYPSIRLGCCGWHGWLVSGKFQMQGPT